MKKIALLLIAFVFAFGVNFAQDKKPVIKKDEKKIENKKEDKNAVKKDEKKIEKKEDKKQVEKKK